MPTFSFSKELTVHPANVFALEKLLSPSATPSRMIVCGLPVPDRLTLIACRCDPFRVPPSREYSTSSEISVLGIGWN